MKLIDLSQPIYHDSPRYPADPPIESRLISTHEANGWQVELLTLTSHSGSHIDAPLHKYAGAPAIDDFPLERFTGDAIILDYRQCRPGQPFTSSMLNRTLRGEKNLEERIILIATGWGAKGSSADPLNTPLPFLSPDGAEWLAEQGIRGIGIDHCSIGGKVEPSNRLTHEWLLQANIWVVENLSLPEEVFALPQPVKFWCLPINLRKHGAAFCRPVIVLSD